ncbi:hypothetical protein BD779DRAFT_1495267 [Infundibulicybe gibba]|nr:hypothetical protein BD779DRAFT_1495267 [Infundibulicybe gibba]
MGRTKPKKKAISKATNPPSQPHITTSTSTPSIESLIEKAQSLIVQCDYELAQRFVQRILEKQPTNSVAKEMLGITQLETGDLDAAKQTFLSLIPPHPGALSPPPPSAYLYLAQLCDEPHEALHHYQAAIGVLAAQSDSNSEEVRNSIVRALVGQVEIWMDPSYDLCFDPAAEKTCEDLLAQALKIDPGNAEALQALSSVRMSQQRPDEAKECLEQAWSVWKDLDLDDLKLPPISTRLSFVKLFLELELYTPALLVLHGVMSSDDQEVEAWYLEGWCFFMMAEQARETGGKLDDLTWEELARDARDCLETCQVLHTNQEHPDAPLLEHAKELIFKLDTLGVQASPLDDAEEGEGEWEDLDGSDDDVEMQ